MGNFRGWKQSIDRVAQSKNNRIKEFLYDIQREKDSNKILVLVEDLYIDMLETNDISTKKLDIYLEKYGLFITDKP